ncbi:putative inorganic phosphate cotransporter isoform X1 [Lycorma delicatula]|uniref:putative inorganic phosphate cotransporter isoform X1 n=1 Tax=Lycorma delicatula TaxID=130591 RepID=UPI003F5111CE
MAVPNDQNGDLNWSFQDTEKLLIPRRYTIAVLCFFGLANAYIMRFCISIALNEMVSYVPSNETVAFEDPNMCSYDNDTATIVIAENLEGEFDWSEQAQGVILSAFFWGYILTQVPGGLLAERVGGKHTLALGILISTICTLLTPLAAREGGVLGLIEVRIIMGLGQGFVYPSLNVLLAHWAPQQERGRLGSIVFAGSNFGTVVAMAVSGVLLSWFPDGAWHYLFYFYGGSGVIWLTLWWRMGYSSPINHPYISDKERTYLKKYYDESKLQETPLTPWGSIMQSKPLWGLIVCQIGHDWGLFTIITDLPKYMSNVLHFTIAQNGLLLSLPHLFMWSVAWSSGWLVDLMMEKKIFTVTKTRKIFTTLATIGPALGILCATYSGCNRFLVMSLLTIGMGSMGFFYPSLKVNSLDLSPNYAGTLMALVNGIGAISGVCTPYVTGLLISDNSLTQWRMVFWISVLVLIFTNLFYLLTGSAEEQPWNDPKFSLQLEDFPSSMERNNHNRIEIH